MKLLVGLGNPGGKYARNRHNIGMMAVDRIAADHGFGPWRSKFNGQISEGRLGPEKVLLLKPETFMNLSGDSVQAAAGFYRLEPGDIIVLHDELDLAPGKVRVKTGGGHAGHNGLRSIDAHMGAQFQRVRMGIGHPGDKRLVSNHVLGDFTKADADWLEPLLEGVSDGAPALVEGNGGAFSNAVARRLKPDEAPRPARGSPATKAPPEPAKPGTDASGAPKPTSEPEPVQSILQKLVDRFR